MKRTNKFTGRSFLTLVIFALCVSLSMGLACGCCDAPGTSYGEDFLSYMIINSKTN